MSRPLIVANRLPITIRLRAGDLQLVDSAGGLATGLRSCHEEAEGVWIGWPGDLTRLEESVRGELAAELERRRLVPVELSRDEVRRYYEGFSNAVLWPLFHYLLDRVPLESGGWDAYAAANRKFADAVVARYRPGDRIWVHDYQLMLAPALIRERLPHARIGFFLHIPFPGPDAFSILPWRRELLGGLLGADLVGFHTYDYVANFVSAVQRLLGVDPGVDHVRVQGRVTRFACFPMGIDAARFDGLARDPGVDRLAAELREEAGGRQTFLGVDRLDYTKGIPRRLLAFQRLLERRPELRERVRLIQVAVPSRTGVDSYHAFRRQLDELVGRINGAVGTLTSTPIRYLFQSVQARQLVALYRAADVMVVTPLRDGMNLVAKEFIASRPEHDGVLVLSEFAGAASELGEALLVNPYDIDELAQTMERALTMSRAERGRRMKALGDRVRQRTVQRWAEGFLEALGREAPVQEVARPDAFVADVASRVREAPAAILLLDADGTLLPIADLPDLVRPDAELLDLLALLGLRYDVHIVSGRPRETLDRWFGDLAIGLWAEHGLWFRPARSDAWTARVAPDQRWREAVGRILEDFASVTPGSFVEEKSVALAWHYRLADPDVGARHARELRLLLRDLLQTHRAEVIEGHAVVEVRPSDAHKGAIVRHLRDRADPGVTVLAIGDDRTDEDMFQALSGSGLSIRVGPGETAAGYRLDSPDAVRRLLGRLAEP